MIKKEKISKKTILLNNYVPTLITFEKPKKISCMIILKDKRIALCFKTQVGIYDSKLIKQEILIDLKNIQFPLTKISQISDERILLCYSRGPVEIVNLISKNSYKIEQRINGIFEGFKPLELSNNNIVLLSQEGILFTYKKNNSNDFNFYKRITLFNIPTLTLSDMKEIPKTNEIVYVSHKSGKIFFVDFENNKLTHILNSHNEKIFFEALFILNSEILFVGGFQSMICIIDIKNYQIIQHIIFQNYMVHNFIKLSENSLLSGGQLLSSQKGIIIQFIYEEELKLIEIKSDIHKSRVIEILELNQYSFFTRDQSSKIYIWERKNPNIIKSRKKSIKK